MREGMLHIHDVEGPKKTGSVEVRLEAMEQHVFKCQGMVERGLNANHMMITEFTNKHKIDANDIGKHLSRIYDKIDHLQAQIYDLHNQNWTAPPGTPSSSTIGTAPPGTPSSLHISGPLNGSAPLNGGGPLSDSPPVSPDIDDSLSDSPPICADGI
ncbi:40S ribosomal protein S5-1 [Hordeum vulgare]|nr:40S ribosomal protein S5-1 [Hordeum vulgare]